MNVFKNIMFILLIAILGYVVIAWTIFQVKHTSASQIRFYTHFIDVVTLNEVDKLK
jgi:hypothetical protein